MSSTWIAVLTFVSTTLFVVSAVSTVYALFFQYRNQLDERVRGLNATSRSVPLGSLFKYHGSIGDDRRTMSLRGRAEAYFDSADVNIAFDFYVQATLGAAFVATCLLTAAMNRWWPAPIAFTAVTAISAGFVVVRRRRRQRMLMTQLPKALDVISRAVRAGQTVPAAFQLVADDFDPPISDEFRLCYEEQNLGISHETALRNLARRTGVMELQILVVALLVQTRSGGNLVELLGNLSQMVHKRLRLQDRVRALTGEGRMQAAVLIALPTVAFVLLLFIAHDYVKTLLAYPTLLGMSVGAQLLGALWIRRCIHFKY